jgi:hypothetical protein
MPQGTITPPQGHGSDVQAQLQAILDDFLAAGVRLGRLAAEVPEAVWGIRPAPSSWSVSECIQHLSLTTAAYSAAAEEAIGAARSLGGPAPDRYRRDLAGWFLWRMVTPVPIRRMPTTARFIPPAVESKESVLAEFSHWQAAERSWVERSDGLPIHRVKVVSPFNPRLRYSLYAALTILPRHEHRHLWQAEQAWAAVRASNR